MKKSLMKKSLICLAVLSCVGQLQAYQAEVSAKIDTSDTNDFVGVGGEFYLHGIEQQSGPLLEASFLAQTHILRANFIDTDFGSRLQLGGRYVDQTSGFFLDGNLGMGDLDGIEVGAGLYLSSNSTVAFSYYTNDFLDELAGRYKHVVFQNDGRYLNLEAGIDFIEVDTVFSSDDRVAVMASADYFLDKTLSLGAGLEILSGDFQDGKILSGRVTQFLTAHFFLTGGLSYSDYDGSDSDVGVQLAAHMRL